MQKEVIGNKTILLLINEAKLRAFLEKPLKSHGYQVVSVYSEKELPEALRGNPGELIITNAILDLPKKYSHVRVIVVCEKEKRGIQAFVHLAKRLGAFAVIPLPFEEAKFLQIVSGALLRNQPHPGEQGEE